MPGDDVDAQPTSSPDISAGLFGCDYLRFELDAQRLGNTLAVGRIRLGAVADIPLLDVQFRVSHGTRRVIVQQLLLLRRHLPELHAALVPMVVTYTMHPVLRY